MLERPLVDRRGEGVVDHRRDPALPAERPDRRQVRDLHERVGRRLGVDQFRPRADGRGELRDARLVDDAALDPPARQHLAEEGHRPGVVVALRDDVVAAPEPAEDGGEDRAHPGPGDHGRLAALERGERRLDLPVRRVAVARVELGRVRGGGDLGEFLGRVGAEGRRLPDRRRHCRGPVELAGGVDRARLRALPPRGISVLEFSLGFHC